MLHLPAPDESALGYRPSPLLDGEFLELTPNLDPAAFWAENARCEALGAAAPRAALRLSPDDHWLFEFLQVPQTVRYYRDKPWRDALHRQANAWTRVAVGREFFPEDTWEHAPRRIENLFGCEFAYHEGGTPWLQPVTNDPAEFSRILDRAAATDLRRWALPEPFLEEWERRRAAGLPLGHHGTGSRGPATVMTSVLDTETVFYWLADHPELIARFRDVLAVKMVELGRVLREFSGCAWNGWWITDDNCALFSPALYEEYCAPVVAAVLQAFAAAPGAYRYQHSDSAMGHLLDQQRALGINQVNYGPEVPTARIREKMPEAVIQGHLPPFLLRNGRPEEVAQRLRADFAAAGVPGRYVATTAGSLAAGTGLGRIRWYLQGVADFCRWS